MERKIGEIFEYNGEWYQCSERGGCSECGFEHILCEKVKSVRGDCLKSKRKDRKGAIFKKLEKVGEPYKKRVSDGTLSTFQRYRVYNSVILPKEPYIYCNFIDGTIEIEIKQTKEDMEEKKLKLKPFDLEAAKAGKPVCTRDGRKARIICFDKEGEQPIVALIENNGVESINTFFLNGHIYSRSEEVAGDLMMLPERHEGWVNVYNRLGVVTFSHNPYDTKEEALEELKSASGRAYCVDTIKVNWSE